MIDFKRRGIENTNRCRRRSTCPGQNMFRGNERDENQQNGKTSEEPRAIFFAASIFPEEEMEVDG